MIPDADIVWDKREQSRIEAQIKKQQELKLIDKVSGRGTWDRNPFVWRIEFELVK